MPDAARLLGFALASAVLMLVPGPNVALIVATSMRHGVRQGLLTVCGTASAMVVQLALVALGLAGLLGAAGHALEWLRWAGAAYLVLLGIAQWRAAPAPLDRPPKPPQASWSRGFLVSLANPKTLLFYAAFFPQFITPQRDVGSQVLLLAGVFLMLALTIDSGWALAAGRARGLLARRRRLGQRVAGSVLIAAGAGLAVGEKKGLLF